MFKSLLVSIRALLVFTVLFGVLYPVSVSLYSKLLFSDKAEGSLLYEKDKAVGSKWIGQYNNDKRYFWPRPSTTTPPYNASASGSSNAAITDPQYKKTLEMRIAALKKAHPKFKDKIPADMVTASASGLDPHISPEAAMMQISRVAAARSMSVDEVTELVQAHITDKQFSVLGRPRVDVLKLNIDLDNEKPNKP